MKVIAVSECFVDGHRRRLGAEFEIEVGDFTDHRGELRLPPCIMPAGPEARAVIDEIRSRPFRAARASAGNPSRVVEPRTRADFELSEASPFNITPEQRRSKSPYRTK